MACLCAVIIGAALIVPVDAAPARAAAPIAVLPGATPNVGAAAGGHAEVKLSADLTDDVHLAPRCSWWDLPCLAWDAYRAWMNQDVTSAAIVWGSLHGGHCKTPSDVVWICTDMTGGYGQGGGVAVGSTYLTGDPSISQGEFRHEKKHADQWAIFGFPMLPAYVAAYFGSEASSGNQCANVFEWWAGFDDGYYDC
jgi:hypothetical protein